MIEELTFYLQNTRNNYNIILLTLMRNIKTMLRISRNSALLLTAMAGAGYLASCSNEMGPNTDPVNEPAMETSSYTVYGSNPNRVRNYGSSTTRAGYVEATELFEMPDMPGIPSDAKDFLEKDEWGNTPNYQYGSPAPGSYFIKAGDKMENGLQLNGNVDIYVAGHLKLTSLGSSNTENNFYILPGGTLEFYSTITPNVAVYNWGDITGELTIGPDWNGGVGKVYSAVDIVNVKNFGVNTYGEFYCKGTVSADDVRLNGKAIACAFIAENNITFNDGGTFWASYFKAQDITMNGGYLTLDDEGLVWATRNLFATNEKARISTVGDNALVYAEKVESNWRDQLYANFEDANVKLVYKNQKVGGWPHAEKTTTNIYSVAEVSEGSDSFGAELGVEAAGCHKAFGPKGDGFDEKDDDPTPDPEPEPDYVLIPVADIENPGDEEGLKHEHGRISATCISFDAFGNAYASFHRRGTSESDYNKDDQIGHKGCIEKIVNNGGAFALTSYMIAPDWDFNHLIADGDRIITVGNHVKKGAFIGALPTDFAASQGVHDDFLAKELTTDEVIYAKSEKSDEEIKAGYKNAGDGNCVVRVGDYYYVTTYEGYGALNTDFTKAGAFTATPGSSKHIAVNGTNMAVLSLDERKVAESPATVKEYALSDKDFATEIKSFAAGTNVAPIDGKNTIAYKGSDLFTCLSKGGLYKNGQKFFQRGTQVPANGITIVGDYIFVANGSFLSVLDKDGNELCYYHDLSENPHSCNFVAVNNGYIYVAFGQSDVKIFRLAGAKVDPNWANIENK